ncbi:MAG: M23 family metallopeptidase [Desulfohalobiaceae bacterium]|nr:M23 family metallopeptidase [Desulfohalobiaceae bacterium]
MVLSLLSLVSFHKDSLVRRTRAVSPETASVEGNNTGTEALLRDFAVWKVEPFSLSQGKNPVAPESGPSASAETSSTRTQCLYVESGDTASSILSDYLGPSDIFRLSRECRDAYPLNRIKTGHEYRLLFQDERLIGFEYDIDAESKLHVAIEDGDFRARRERIDYDTRDKLIRSRIEASLFQAVEQAGGTASLAVSLSQIFAWDIDFIRDVRQGDSFRLLVTERYRRGEFVGYGKIKAARFVNQGQEFNAFLYRTSAGREEYFDSQGQALRKTFLKAPLQFSRISSGYTWKRRHPVLDTVRPHLGIDYAASRGTPIKSVARGRVVEKSYSREAGNYLKIRHPNHYVTVYNHMSGYAAGIHAGAELEQGKVIGYVGSTGLSTGPHLDYRVKRYGKYKNPRKIESKPVKSIPEPEMTAFRQTIRPLRAALNSKGPELAALSGQEPR